MKPLVLALMLTAAFAAGAHAEVGSLRNALPQAVGIHMVSWHDRGDFNNANVGIALRWDGGLTIGGFHNSYERPSAYGGLVVPVFERRAFQLQLMAGMVTGYSEANPADLVAVPILGWRVSPRNTLQVAFMPRFVIPANVVHVMFERRLADPAPRATR